MRILFVSDMHLSATRSAVVSSFIDFLDSAPRCADVLYILGDCFDRWLGDDDDTPPNPAIVEALSSATRAGLPVHVLRGNHDFLLGAGFESASGCRLLGDPSVIEVHGTRVLIMHGDTLCTDDVDYQHYRAYTRDAGNQRAFLSLPLGERAARAEQISAQSRTQTALKPDEVMDVNHDAVVEAMRHHGVSYLIHGHTHRPAIHHVCVDGAPATRIVLGDWYEHGHVLEWDEQGYRTAPLASPCNAARTA